MNSGANSGPELLVELDRSARRPLRAQLEDGLRDAVRSGRLEAGARLPATRALALDLGVSRRLVVDAYAQLLAEGYLVARRGAGTYVAEAAGASTVSAAEPALASLSYDFFPGYPDLASFPRRAWLRAILIHASLNARRRPREARIESSGVARDIPGTTTSPSQAAQKNSSREELDAALVAHPRQREIVLPVAGPALGHRGDAAAGGAVRAEQADLQLVAAGHRQAIGLRKSYAHDSLPDR